MDAIVSASSSLIRPSSLYQVRAVASSSTFISTGSLSSSHIASAANNLLLLKSLRRTRTCSLAGSRPPMINCAGGIKEIGESEFSSTVLESDRPVLVEFVATWCGPCRLIYPAMEALAQEYGDRLTIVKIDHDANPKLIEEYKVYGLPSFILFKNGQEVAGSRREGAITKAKLKDYIENLLDTISVSELSSGNS